MNCLFICIFDVENINEVAKVENKKTRIRREEYETRHLTKRNVNKTNLTAQFFGGSNTIYFDSLF